MVEPYTNALSLPTANAWRKNNAMESIRAEKAE